MPAGSKKVEEAVQLLKAVGFPLDDWSKRRKHRVALAMLAIADIRPRTKWSDAKIWGDGTEFKLKTRDIIEFWNEHYGENIARSSYDDVRRKDLIHLVESGIADSSAGNPDANPNNPTRAYAISAAAKELLRTFGTTRFEQAARNFIDCHGVYSDKIHRPRSCKMIDATLPNGKSIELTLGPHNEIQKNIVEEFLPRFVPGSEVLYIGDTAKKMLVKNEEKLLELGFFDLAHDALPDVVAYCSDKNWMIIIEAVHSSNPISPTRHLMLERMTKKCSAPRVYVSAFLNREEFRKWVPEISWETEVWLADRPDHLIHFNGDKFLGPHSSN